MKLDKEFSLLKAIGIGELQPLKQTMRLMMHLCFACYATVVTITTVAANTAVGFVGPLTFETRQAKSDQEQYCKTFTQEESPHVSKLCLDAVQIHWRKIEDQHGPLFDIRFAWQLAPIISIKPTHPNVPRQVNIHQLPSQFSSALSEVRLGFGNYIVIEVHDSQAKSSNIKAYLKLLLQPSSQGPSNRPHEFTLSAQWQQLFLSKTGADICTKTPRFLAPAPARSLFQAPFALKNMRLCKLNLVGLQSINEELVYSCEWAKRKEISSCERDLQLKLHQRKIDTTATRVLEQLDKINESSIKVPRYPTNSLRLLQNLNSEHVRYRETRDQFMYSIAAAIDKNILANDRAAAAQLLQQARWAAPNSDIISHAEQRLLQGNKCFVAFQKRCRHVTHSTPIQVLPFSCPAEGSINLDHFSLPVSVNASNSELRKNIPLRKLSLDFAKNFPWEDIATCRKSSDWKNKTQARVFRTAESLENRLRLELKPDFSECIPYLAASSVTLKPNSVCSSELIKQIIEQPAVRATYQ